MAKHFLLQICRACLMVVFMLASLSASKAQAVESTTLRFAYETKAVPPYFMGENEEIPAKPGVTPELLLLLEKKIPGLKIEMQRMPWKRCLAQLQKGEVDAVVASYNKERASFAVYPMKGNQADTQYRIDTKAYYLYTLSNSKINWDGKQLIAVDGAIGAPLGYSIIEDLKLLKVPVEESNGAEKILEKLVLQRLTGVALLEKVGDTLLQKARFKGIVKRQPALASKDYYLLLSQQFVSKYPELSQQIWQALAQLRENESEVILMQYVE